MAFDTIMLAAVTDELGRQLPGARLGRIHQPDAHTLILHLFAGGKNRRLLLSAHPRHARMHLTATERKNPPSPPMFCMLLRKYLEGGRLVAVEQAGYERIVRLAFSVLDELGNPTQYTLCCEIMGKHSNIVLVAADGRIVDAIRRVTEAVNRYREVLPGLAYVPPPPQDKLAAAQATAAALVARWQSSDPTKPLWRALVDHVAGLSPLAARELAAQAGLTACRLGEVTPAKAQLLAELIAKWAAWLPNGPYAPALLYDVAGRLVDFTAMPLAHWPARREPYPTPSAALDAFFALQEEDDRRTRLQARLQRVVRTEMQRCAKKLHLQEEALRHSEDAEAYRLQGELLTAHLHAVPRGAAHVTVSNFYDPSGSELRIELDPTRTAAENAQALFRRYQKARSGRSQISAQLAATRQEQAWLAAIDRDLAAAASLPDLEEIRQRLLRSGYLTEAQPRRHGRPPRPAGAATPVGEGGARSGPLTLYTADGLEVWVGRTARQNDYLTLRLAAPGDLWFHVKEVGGAHVILRLPPGKEAPEQSLWQAAALAAYFSRARHSSGVAVDYTRRKHVKKPKGAREGYVIYDHHQTLFVTPDPARLPPGLPDLE